MIGLGTAINCCRWEQEEEEKVELVEEKVELVE